MSQAGCWVDVPDGSPFPLANLPLGVGATAGSAPTIVVAIGDHSLDLGQAAGLGLLDDIGIARAAFGAPSLNPLLSSGREAGRRLRQRIHGLLTDPMMADRLADAVVTRDELVMAVPMEIGDYVDFYSSIHHATNIGRMFRPGGDPLPANWRALPMGYHGRASSIVASGTPVTRPAGLRGTDAGPVFGPTAALDIELEVGVVIGTPSDAGRPIPTNQAADHVAGLCLVNDWSARDVQAFEYQPLGPFLGKSFATSVSPWLVSLDALEPYRVAAPEQDPPVAPHLRRTDDWALDLALEVLIETASMRAAGITPVAISRTRFDDMYWTLDQQLAHVTSNGSRVRTGDLLASGTVSGPTPGSEGSLIELTQNGDRPIELPTGETRRFLDDGDRVILRGWAGGDDRPPIGFGEVSATIVPAVSP